MRIPEACLCLLLAVVPEVFGAGTTAWEMNSYQDFIRGRFESLSLTRDGALTVAPKMDTLFSSDQPVVWTLVRAKDGTIYAATGHHGRLYAIDKSGASRLVWTAPQPEIFALAIDASGALYAGTSPNGKIYRIENGKAAEYFAPGAAYIWALATGPDSVLYAGTGGDGKIFRVTAAGKGEVYYETGQSHVTSLAVDRQGRLLAGSEPNGILYRVSAKGKAFVLYDANLPEIRSIVAAPDGAIYAAALGGSTSKRAAGALQAAQANAAASGVPTVTTTITVTSDSQAGEVKPQQPQDPNAAKVAQAAAATTTAATPVVDLTGVEKSALYRINPDNTVETLWSSKEENVYDVLATAGQLLFTTDGYGRIYRMAQDRKVTLVTETNESESTRLVGEGGEVLAATGNLGRIYRLGDKPAAVGKYESPIHDAGGVARWGQLTWRSDGPAPSLRTRSGNSLRPDATWSDWSEPLTAPGQMRSPNARYAQWKAELRAGALLQQVTLSYVPQNLPPVVKSISVFTIPAPAGYSKAATQPSQAVTAYTVTVSDSGDATSPSSGTPTQALSRAASQQISVTWQADDPDGDRLLYALYFRGEDERDWKLLKANIHENTYTIDGDALADGRYFFRVTASDREANPASSARESDLASSPVLIDNTPPVVHLSAPRRTGAGLEIDVEAVDAASPLRRCDYSVDAGPWTPLEAADGVIDSPRENFAVHLANLAGEHVVVVRAVDSAGNAGLAKLVVK